MFTFHIHFDDDDDRDESEFCLPGCKYRRVQFNVRDVRRLRTGASGFIHFRYLHETPGIELLKDDIERVARKHPELRFRLEHDGIAGFDILTGDVGGTDADDLLLHADDYYFEDCHQRGAHEFEQRLEDLLAGREGRPAGAAAPAGRQRRGLFGLRR